MEYSGRVMPTFTDDEYMLDGTVRIVENISYYRYEPQRIYEIKMALKCMSEDEIIKTMKYIMRITNKRVVFDIKTKKQREKETMQALKRLSDKKKS